ncbi:acyl-CoA dehydrogenase family protein [Acuticoccus sp.]|uniref:acyl-CoA dehydrogenase family protein n=1 Tax=Acuticoccus sp. TaxID=1904378 RepID=UPI003B51DE7A
MLGERTVYEPEHEMFRRTAANFYDTEVVPHQREWEREGKVSREVWRKAGEQGLLLTTAPEEYGGGGADFRAAAVLIEEAAKRLCAGPGFALHSDIVAPYVAHYGTEDQKREWLPKMASGETIGAIAMTEPGAGSDVQNIRTNARRDGNELVINGSKTFISNGEIADVVLVACKTDPSLGAKGISLVLVETDREGFSRGNKLEKIGEKSQDIAELYFDEVRVPPSNLVGEEGRGFKYLMTELPQERLILVLRACAVMEAAYGWTRDYVKERHAFGKPLLNLQNIRFRLAEVKTDVEVARLYTDRCLELHLRGELDVPTVCAAKFWVTEMEQKVLDTCLQMFGGYGYIADYPIARAWQNCRVHRIYAGTNEIMREVVARSI